MNINQLKWQILTMGKPSLSLLSLILVTVNLFAAPTETIQTLDTGSGVLEGSLLIPDTPQNTIPVVLLISGSGPTDRNGNNPWMTNNSLKFLADALALNGIASLRYDKRGIAHSASAAVQEEHLRFEHYAADAARWVNKLKRDKRFGAVTVIGHSEGSLIGMLALQQQPADAFISLAGVGQPADLLLKRQLKSQPAHLLNSSLAIIRSLKAGKTVAPIDPVLAPIFRPGVQPYMISWFQYDPAIEIASLKVPVLILQGSTDLQVSMEDASLLAKAQPDAESMVIQGMNHVLKDSAIEVSVNLDTYNHPSLPVNTELVSVITAFISRVKRLSQPPQATASMSIKTEDGTIHL